MPRGVRRHARAGTATAIVAAVETGMMAINRRGLARPEGRFGGVTDRGYGPEAVLPRSRAI
ncbi:MAG: hypothetical protein FWD12_10615 [Alphaproteobacteria bacterium]|nr:hypothetical protein [Alphaproteobacteria bacterium]